MENIYHEGINEKKARMAILLSDKVDIRAKEITRDIMGHYIMVKESSQQKDVIFLFFLILFFSVTSDIQYII